MDDGVNPTGTGGEPGHKSFIGGRHGSPTVTVALPFSTITTVDGDLRAAVAELATLVARLAGHVGADDRSAVEAVRLAAEELAGTLEEAGP
jgi:hypothetical protein